MEKIVPENPVVILLYGFPGSGKTYFARQFCEEIQAAHLEQDRLRYELFEQPRYSKQENFAVNRIMDYMTTEFLNSGASVVYDTNAMRHSQRRNLFEIAHRYKAEILIVWFQVDADTAYLRSNKRDRRRLDDRFAATYTVDQFKEIAAYMQQPESTEEFIVVSGKHSYPSQRSNVLKRLADKHVLNQGSIVHKMVRPDLVNLVPSSQRDQSQNGSHPITLS